MLKRLLRRAADRVDPWLVPLFARTGWLASVYYLLFSRQFHREHRAVLAGRLEYARSLRRPVRSSPLLRRNVHRLEKGLVMKPRADVFADDYAEETVAELARLRAARTLEPDEDRWATDVLAEYFAVVKDTPRIARARAAFGALPSAGEPVDCTPAVAAITGSSGAASIPRRRASHATSSVTYDDFIALCTQRRSVRWFERKPVPRNAVLKAIAAAAQAPSACNRQPFLFRYFGEPGDAQRVASIAMGTAGYVNGIPALAVVIADLSCYPEERDRHVAYIDASLAAMQFMLALETLGLASCPINWPDIEYRERAMDTELGLPRHMRPVMLIALGYPDPEGGVPHSAKKPVDSLLRDRNEYPT